MIGAEDEGRLVDRFVNHGDERAFEALARIHLPAIRRFLAMRLRKGEELEEAEQELLVRMYQSLPGWRGDSSLRTWLYRLCAVGAADLARRKAREREKSRRLAIVGKETGGRESDRADWDLHRSSEVELVRACLASLGEPAASLLYLRDAEGFGLDELSVIFGIPQGTVKSRLSRARDRLRILLARAGFGEARNEDRGPNEE